MKPNVYGSAKHKKKNFTRTTARKQTEPLKNNPTPITSHDPLAIFRTDETSPAKLSLDT